MATVIPSPGSGVGFYHPAGPLFGGKPVAARNTSGAKGLSLAQMGMPLIGAAPKKGGK